MKVMAATLTPERALVIPGGAAQQPEKGIRNGASRIRFPSLRSGLIQDEASRAGD
jgi:hypothetical protein